MNRPSRFLRFLRIAGLVVATLVIVAAIPWTYYNITLGRELQQELGKLRAEGVPLTMPEAAPKPVPDDQNAAVLYMKVFQVSFDTPQPTDQSSSKTGLNRFEVPSGYKPGDSASAFAELMRPVLTTPDCQAALRAVREASLRPSSVFPVRWDLGPDTLFPHMAQFRQAARLCAAQAMLSAKDSNLNQALDWLGVCYRMANHASQEPTLIGQLVAIAMLQITSRTTEAILSQADPTPQQAAALLRDAGGLDLARSFHQAMLGERTFGLDFFDRVRLRKSSLQELLGDESLLALQAPLSRVMPGLGRPYWKLEELNYLSHMSRAIERSQQPWRATRGEPEEAPVRLGSIMARILMPTLSRASAKRDQALAEMSLLRQALDLKLYRRAHGAYPAALAGTGLPAQEDVFAGKALHYRRQGQGFIVWSVGPNLKDDGGKPPARSGDIDKEGDLLWECAR
jgi:hypothetical protein